MPPSWFPWARTPEGRLRVAATAALCVTFLGGALVGAGVVRIHRGDGARWSLLRGKDRSDRERLPLSDRREQHTLDELLLTPAQQARVDSILETGRREAEVFWTLRGEQLRAIVDATRADIRGVLTAEQRARYDSLLAVRRHRERGSPKPDKERQ